MEFIFLLADSINSRNIGAAARAMKSMGHSQLRLIRCTDHLTKDAEALAVGSYDVVEAAQTFDSTQEACHDIDLLVATTMRHRRRKSIYSAIGDLPELISKKGSAVKKVGILFGGEKSGLKTEDMELCDIVSTIPTAGTHPAVNLAQAVMIYSYELATKVKVQTQDQRQDNQTVSVDDYKNLKDSTMALLDQIGIPDDKPIRRNVLQALGRLGYDDLYLVQNIRQRVAKKLQENKKEK